jgi:hypothetical protein
MGLKDLIKKGKEKLVGKDYKILIVDPVYSGAIDLVVGDHIASVTDRIHKSKNSEYIAGVTTLEPLMKVLKNYDMIFYDWNLEDKPGHKFFEEALNHHGEDIKDKIVFSLYPDENHDAVTGALNDVLRSYLKGKHGEQWESKYKPYSPRFIRKDMRNGRLLDDQAKAVRKHANELLFGYYVGNSK